MHRRVALHVGQREIGLAVAAIGGAEQREQRGVLRQRQDLPVAERPALGREVEREDTDFGDEWIHGVLLGLRREDPEERNDEIEAEIGLEIGVRLAAADGTDRLWGHRNRIPAGVVKTGMA